MTALHVSAISALSAVLVMCPLAYALFRWSQANSRHPGHLTFRLSRRAAQLMLLHTLIGAAGMTIVHLHSDQPHTGPTSTALTCTLSIVTALSVVLRRPRPHEQHT
ncbi:hypothetical protein HDA30_000240 [Micrococcus cohnii]|uniref:Uncharacterized protein n=1 Tax=Micrococcus cohnii TaxID=993416 RepID=A0A7W7M236_9MICC|nr:hypothetical protein [Micrococcus cohnii]MBB4734732.1 hypothetical protein [Micrococcus cohnii]